MRAVIRGLRIMIGAALGLLGALAPASGARDQLVIGITQFPSTFNPYIDAMVAKSFILGMTRRPLTAYDKDWRLVCLLCTELPTLESGRARIEPLPDGKKGIALTVTIDPRARWGDGTPITASDMVFTWEVGRHPESGVGNFETFRRILSIDVVDDKTFTLHVDRVTFDYYDLSGLDLLPAHLERQAFADPARYRNRTLFDTDTTNPGLYFGPYRIAEVSPGAHVVLEPNPHWWGAAPHFKRIVVRAIENTAALEANLLSGGIDYIAGELGLAIDQALAFERRHGRAFHVRYKPDLGYEHIDLNLDNPALQDVRVRRALLMALDREAITRTLFGGHQPVAHSFMSPLDLAYDDSVEKHPFDATRAAALLEEAGWHRDADGARTNAAGAPLQLELMTTAGNRTRELVQQALQSQWRKVGVDARIRNEPARVFFGETVSRRKFSAMALYAWISSPESVPRSTLHSTQIPSEANAFVGQNYSGFRNAEADSLIDRIELELDREARRALWRRLQAIYASELPVLPLFFRANAFILPKWLTGVEPTGHQYPSTLWVEEWRAEP